MRKLKLIGARGSAAAPRAGAVGLPAAARLAAAARRGAAPAGAERAGAHHARRARRAHDRRGQPPRSRVRHRFRSRAGSVFPDGPGAPPRRRRARGAVRSGGARGGPQDPALQVPQPRPRGAGRGHRGAARRHRGLYPRRERRPCEPRLPPLGVLGAAAAARALAFRRTSCWSSTRCGGICRRAASGARSCGSELNARLGGPECASSWKCALAFFYPLGTSWDAPVDATAAAAATAAVPVPDAAVLNVRDGSRSGASPAAPLPGPAAGSNNWAVAGSLTTSGAALIANDMHLGLRVPPVWYHARLQLPADGTTAALDLNGVTLPGTPLLVAGSNGHIAWGFTNSYGTWLDVEHVTCVAVGPARAAQLPRAACRCRWCTRRSACTARPRWRWTSPRDRGACCCAPTRRHTTAGSARGWRSCRRRPTSTSWRSSVRPRWRRRCGLRPRSAFRIRTPSSATPRATSPGPSSAAFPRTPDPSAPAAGRPGRPRPTIRASSIRRSDGCGLPTHA